MRLSRRALLGAGLSAGVLGACPALADLRIEITGVGANQLPIAIRSFQGAGSAPVDPAQVIGADLVRSGAFRLIQLRGGDANEDLTKPSGLAAAKQAGATVYVVGSVQPLGPARWDVRCLFYDTVTGEQINSVGFSSSTDLLRMAAHRCADEIYKKMTGEGPMFASQLAYVAQLGPRRYELIITDCDGAVPRTALSSPEPIISPAWSPDGRRLAYVSFENRKPIVFVHELSTGARRPVAAFRGNNSAPAWSPDGRQLAVALSRDGLTQIYLINADGSAARRFSRSYGIDTEPFFTKDGQWIYFTSDRGGTPQIYRQAVNEPEGRAERVTFGSNYAISPVVSPDGKRLAYISKIDDSFRVAVMDLENGQDLLVTNSDRDESPSFAPNGRFIVYATEVSGRGILGTCSADARLSTRLSGEGNIREPAWSPILG
ncbi:Tol-Pal system beta propeller repeat protein TolB [Sutterella sp.]|uniref:Tol-Pal system beta propeller repeat protein TolB n=1 Tax=Sutterella sp. TaxID=1981025 RepID=UPI0026DF5C41|nr:Tol-Pal system beta propeller repeat protein TolB [Sutterella sp.]MDO5531014.1 Tol-Pal system beta propeller repeat protein TolB [Sutterella sp.]